MVRADRLTATERAMLHTGRARALAKLGRVQETASAVGAADEEFSHTRPANDPEYMHYYDAAQHAGDTGHTLWDVAVLGHFTTEARHRLSAAVTGHGQEFVRARTMSKIKFASLVMVTGDLCEAVIRPVGSIALAEQMILWISTSEPSNPVDFHRPDTQCGVWVADRWQGVAVRVARRILLGVAVVCWCWFLRDWILLTARQWRRRRR